MRLEQLPHRNVHWNDSVLPILGVPNVNQPAIEVEIEPLQVANLTASHAGVQRDQHNRVLAIRSYHLIGSNNLLKGEAVWCSIYGSS